MIPDIRSLSLNDAPEARSTERISDTQHVNKTFDESTALGTNQTPCTQEETPPKQILLARLPPEILSVIFNERLRIPDEDSPKLTRRSNTSHKLHAISRNHPSVILSHVCRQWREIALGDPKLWSYFKVCAPEPPRDERDVGYKDHLARWNLEMDRLTLLLDIWLMRSASYRLTFALKVADSRRLVPYRMTMGRLAHLVHQLCNVSTRWRHASFVLSVHMGGTQHSLLAWASDVFRLSREALPALRTIELNIIHRPNLNMDDVGHTSKKLVGLPGDMGVLNGGALRTMKLDLRGGLWLMKAPSSYASLTHLLLRLQMSTVLEDGRCISPGEKMAFDVLKLSPLLVSCEIQLDRVHHSNLLPANIQGSARVCLPYLKTLTLCGTIPSKLFADALDFPALTALHIESKVINLHPQTPPEFIQEFREGLPHWFRRFGPQLLEASLPESILNDYEFGQIMACLKNVTYLSLTSIGEWPYHYPHRAAQTLTFDERRWCEPSWLPNLKWLECDMTAYPSVRGMFTEETLLEFIVARRPPAGLQAVFVRFPIVKTMDIRGQLEARGVDLTGFKLKLCYVEPSPLRLPDFDEDIADGREEFSDSE